MLMTTRLAVKNSAYKGMLLVAALIFMLLVPSHVHAANDGDFMYELIGENKDEVRILRYTGTVPNVVIPAKIAGRIVTEIAGGAFFNNQTVKQVMFEGKNVDLIGESTFYNCTNLTYIGISQTKLKTIGSTAFYNCRKLDYVFLPDTVLNIGERAFSGCENLSIITLGQSIQNIGQMAFADCTSLLNITLPESIEKIWTEDKTGIYGGVFYGCTSLETVKINGQITKIPENTFYRCKSLKSFDMPDSVTELGARAFSQCTSLKSIQLSRQLSTIGKGAFFFCKNLKMMTLPESVITIDSGSQEEDYTFGKCTSLEIVVFSRQLTNIATNAFYGCTSLTSVTLPESLLVLNSGAFANCSKLSSVFTLGNIPFFSESAISGCNERLTFYYQNGYSNVNAGKHPSAVFYRNRTHVPIYYNNNDTEEGTITASIKGEAELGKTISEPIPPTRKGYSFDGWRTAEGHKWDFSKNIVKNSITLIAQWKVNYYEISFDAKGGSLKETSKSIAFKKAIGTLPIPTRADYEFQGWFTDINGEGKEYHSDTVMDDADVILYAKWKLNPKPPAKPVIQAEIYSPTKIKITWKKVSGISGYDIYRSNSANGQYTKIRSVGPGVIGMINTKLVQGKTYYYKVCTFRTVEGQKFYSAYSNRVKVKMNGKPATPMLTVKKKSATSTDLSWSISSQPDGFEVYVKNKATDKFKKFATYKGNVPGCYHTELTKGKTYYYTVRAYAVVNGKRLYSNYAATKKIKL